tara:strand:- start:6902 stop:7519 length:618 start_codon:yes stop_codon:yes gene_type:complete
MKLIDLSYPISEKTPTYPTDPDVQFIKEKEIKKDKTLLHSFKMGTHTGTHLDVPAHVIPNGKTISDYSLESFHGRGVLVDKTNYFKLINTDSIDTIIYNTGWYKKFNDPNTFFGKDRPIIPNDLIEYVKNNNIKIFGCDLPSVDASGSDIKPIHNALLKDEIIIYESLTNLDKLTALKSFQFYGFPLSFEALDGSPVRAAAFIDV